MQIVRFPYRIHANELGTHRRTLQIASISHGDGSVLALVISPRVKKTLPLATAAVGGFKLDPLQVDQSRLKPVESG